MRIQELVVLTNCDAMFLVRPDENSNFNSVLSSSCASPDTRTALWGESERLICCPIRPQPHVGNFSYPHISLLSTENHQPHPPAPLFTWTLSTPNSNDISSSMSVPIRPSCPPEDSLSLLADACKSSNSLHLPDKHTNSQQSIVTTKKKSTRLSRMERERQLLSFDSRFVPNNIKRHSERRMCGCAECTEHK